MPSKAIDAAVRAIAPPSQDYEARARRRQDLLTKPTGALGRLETYAIRLAGIQRTDRPDLGPGALVLFAADHGVARRGVSAYPSEVTGQMVQNFLGGGAAVNVLARALDFEVRIVDVGVNALLPDHDRLIRAALGPGTADMHEGPAMTSAQAVRGIEIGIEQTERALTDGAGLFVPGEMGIGNTTAATALGAVLTGRPPADLVGRGTGLDDAQLAEKLRVITHAIERNAPDPTDPLDVAAKLGGFEIVAAAGAILGAAARGVTVVLDGFIIAAAALIAVRLAPGALAYCFAGHRSAERGHALLLRELGLDPVLNLELRLGEGTGALLASGILRAACALHNEMATFDTAGVSDRE